MEKRIDEILVKNRHPTKDEQKERERKVQRKEKAIFNFCAMIYTFIPLRRMHTLVEPSRQVPNPQGNETNILTTRQPQLKQCQQFGEKKSKTNKNMVA